MCNVDEESLKLFGQKLEDKRSLRRISRKSYYNIKRWDLVDLTRKFGLNRWEGGRETISSLSERPSSSPVLPSLEIELYLEHDRKIKSNDLNMFCLRIKIFRGVTSCRLVNIDLRVEISCCLH